MDVEIIESVHWQDGVPPKMVFHSNEDEFSSKRREFGRTVLQSNLDRFSFKQDKGGKRHPSFCGPMARVFIIKAHIGADSASLLSRSIKFRAGTVSDESMGQSNPSIRPSGFVGFATILLTTKIVLLPDTTV